MRTSIGLSEFHTRAPRTVLADPDAEEALALQRYLSLAALGAVVTEAARRADAMGRLDAALAPAR